MLFYNHGRKLEVHMINKYKATTKRLDGQYYYQLESGSNIIRSLIPVNTRLAAKVHANIWLEESLKNKVINIVGAVIINK